MTKVVSNGLSPSWAKVPKEKQLGLGYNGGGNRRTMNTSHTLLLSRPRSPLSSSFHQMDPSAFFSYEPF